MSFLSKLFRKSKPKNPEDYYVVTITSEFVEVRFLDKEPAKILWDNIIEIKLINTNEGPILPDIFLQLLGERSGCKIPYGTKGFDQVYEIVSKYENFNFENVTESMSCTENKEFLLWKE
jgi:hypothetical protein